MFVQELGRGFEDVRELVEHAKSTPENGRLFLAYVVGALSQAGARAQTAFQDILGRSEDGCMAASFAQTQIREGRYRIFETALYLALVRCDTGALKIIGAAVEDDEALANRTAYGFTLWKEASKSARPVVLTPYQIAAAIPKKKAARLLMTVRAAGVLGIK